jgi:hypothetical protein
MCTDTTLICIALIGMIAYFVYLDVNNAIDMKLQGRY